MCGRALIRGQASATFCSLSSDYEFANFTLAQF